MKFNRLLTFLAFAFLPIFLFGQNDEKIGKDTALAIALGADDYGMKQYVMAFLKRGPNRDRTPAQAAELQKAHLENIGRLAEEGKLVLAGPFMDDGKMRGIYIFNVTTVEEAQELTATDPAIQAGSLVMELHPWYGSAALMKVNEIHESLPTKEF
ncbi:MAG: YciI family protein [Saprospiraceae bacterium]